MKPQYEQTSAPPPCSDHHKRATFAATFDSSFSTSAVICLFYRRSRFLTDGIVQARKSLNRSVLAFMRDLRSKVMLPPSLTVSYLFQGST